MVRFQALNSLDLRTSVGPAAEPLNRAFDLAEEIGWIGCYEIDFSDWSTLMSPTCRAQFGMAPDQQRLSHAEWQTLVHPGDIERMGRHIAAIVARRGDESIEYRIIRPDGSVRWIWARTRIEFDAAGAPLAGYGVQQDITERRLAEDTLRERELHFRTAAEQTSDLIYSYDVDTGAIQWFGDVDGAFGYPPGLFPRTLDGWEAHIQLEDRAAATAALEKHIAEGAPFDVEYRTFSLDGTVRYWIDRGRITQGLDGGRLMVGAMTDVTEQRKTLQALAESEERFRHMADHMPAMAWLTGPDGQTLFLSRSWYDLTGQTPETALGQGWISVIHPQDRKSAITTITEQARGFRTFQNDFRLQLPDGSIRWMLNAGVPRFDKERTFLGYVGCVIDITARKQAEDRITWAAEHDGLTGLANRTRFQAELRTALDEAVVTGDKLALIVFDLDHLKLVNDTLGHDAGDHLIRSVGLRMRDALGSDGLVARLGGDEFGIILRNVEGRHAAVRRAKQLAAQLDEPLHHNGQSIDCRASMGLTLFPNDSHAADELLKNADLALYAAKSEKRGSLIPYRHQMRSDLRQRVRARDSVRRCLGEDRLLPFYQPQIDLSTGRVTGFEALLRLRGAGGKTFGPSKVLTAFEDPNLALEIGDRMLGQVMVDLTAWLDTGAPVGRVAVNASAMEFRAGGYAERVLQQLRAAGLPPELIEIEVTETVLVGRDANVIGAALSTLSAEGVRIALDDFGTGYASLTHLKQFPVDAIKVDRSFVAGLESDEGDRAIASAIVGLGRTLGKDVIAEGVETIAQAQRLEAIGCHAAQGFLFARPLPLAQAIAFAREH